MADLLIRDASQVVTCDAMLFDSEDEDARAVGLVDKGDILISNGEIKAVGRIGETLAGKGEAFRELDASGLVVLPGLIDSHTHTVFAGSREKEYELRLRGASYMEIAEKGGGINSTVDRVRRAGREELVDAALPRLRSMLRTGTTTVEIKSGYGLDLGNEVKMLRAVRELGEVQPVSTVPTFLGAHEFPPEYRDERERYVSVILDDMIPAVAEEGLAEFCDVFCEQGVFTPEQARRILGRARDRGLKPVIHADEFADSGAAQVAADVGALSAAHLGFASEGGLRAMKEAGTVAILLPGVAFGLATLKFADARKMLDLGLDVALATDFNPGSSMVNSLLVISSLACSFMHLTPSEAILGMTRHAARALDREDVIGSISPGKQADLVLFRAPDFRYIPYHLGGDIVEAVVKNGRVVYDKTQEMSQSGRNNTPEAG
jgi:imidazolonepropionase